jgi:isopropylmalate/homocitrate/citramalate synthase
MSKEGFFLSQYQADLERHAPDKVWIFDTTLRDGEQMPGVTYTIDEKILIAQQLDELRVPRIEAGFPITSEGETESVKTSTGPLSAMCLTFTFSSRPATSTSRP